MIDQGIIGLCKGIAQKKSITELQIDISHCENLSETALINMVKYIRKLHDLTRLDLIVKGLDGIADGFMIKLGEAMTRLEKLEKIKLIFDGCAKFSSVGIDRMMEGIASVKSFRYLDISLANCLTNVDEQAFIMLCENLQNMLHVKSIKLNVKNYQKIREKSILGFAQALKQNANSLETLHLNFSGVSSINE